MNLNSIHNVYFLGIGGIGMSAIARYFKISGKQVAGYDLTPSSITSGLEAIGVDIHYVDDINRIPKRFTIKNHSIVVRTPAVPASHSELKFFQENEFTVVKRAEILGLLFNNKRGIAIAGTHGKTSVSSMVTSIMNHSSEKCNAFLGGILKNIKSNLLINENSNWVVTEADEFDRSFLHLNPEIALVTWIDADHLDIYSSEEDIRRTFGEFIGNVKAGGTIILKQGIDLQLRDHHITRYTYALAASTADFYATNIKIVDHRYEFDIQTPGEMISSVRLNSPGLTNVENAVAAASVAFVAGVSNNEIGSGLSTFEGVERRFDIQYENGKRVYIDDYAHHPREIDAVIGSVRKLFPTKKITGVFQPHLYSRTRDFAAEFSNSLSALDELILMDIYPAREDPIEGVSSELIFRNVNAPTKVMCTKENLLDLLSAKDFEILLTMGAGDIDRYVEAVRKIVKEK